MECSKQTLCAVGIGAVGAGLLLYLQGKRQQKMSEDYKSNRVAFAKFIKIVAQDRNSAEYLEFYNDMLQIFVDNDRDFDGRVDAGEFDMMIEQAASLPRRFGFAPTSAEAFESMEARIAHRMALFKAMDTNDDKTISFEEWLTFVYEHIRDKVQTMSTTMILPSPARIEGQGLCPSMQNITNESKEAYKKWIIAACKSRGNVEYKELYAHLLGCFVLADKNKDGSIEFMEFAGLIDIAAAQPRDFGFAPPSSTSFRNEKEKLDSRKEFFDKIDTDRGGSISFDEWLDFAYQHICEKARELDPSLPGVPPAGGFLSGTAMK